ncbi:MAG: transposase [Planctomycetia bacterium]|nr:transposase [Planctomycetia bacterium]
MVNSKTYRGQNVQKVDVAQMVAGREGQAAVVGVDTGKKNLYLAVRWGDGQTDRPVVVSQPEELGLAVDFLQRLSAGRNLRVAIEPSGTYGDAFRYDCHRVGLSVERVSPVASNRHAEVYDGAPSQFDGKDACVVAELCGIGKSTPWPWREASEQEQMLAAHTALMENHQEEVNAWRGRLEGKLARHWPEVSALLALDGTALLEALIYYQSPARLAEDEQAEKRLAEWGGRLLKAEKIKAVVQSARTTRGVPVGVGDGYHLAEIAGRLLESKRRLEMHHRELEKSSAGLRAVTLAGEALGQATMAVLHLACGDPAGYGSGGAYLKALGLNLVERSSGKYVGRLHISKRGRASARRWLYLAALRVLEEPGIKVWYQAKVKRDGGKKGKAVTAVMRKLALGIQHCCRTGEVFHCEKVFQDKTQRKRRGRRRHRGRPASAAGGTGAGAASSPAVVACWAPGET